MTCAYECKKTFHVRCAILRGLIVDYETMKEKQPDPITGEPRVFCAKHTRLFRDLQDDPDMLSQMTCMLSGDEDGDDRGEEDFGINHEEDTFAHFAGDDDELAIVPPEEVMKIMNPELEIVD